MARLRKIRPAHLCHELIVEIFTRLPTKSLLRFRSLSKSWYSFIGCPDFIRMHTLRSRQKLLIRHRAYNENEEDEYEGFYTLHPEDRLPLSPTQGYIGMTPVQFPSTYSCIVGSCNGIVCLWDYNENQITLWNPSIRRKLTAPDCPRRCYSGLDIAFGFDPVSDDYKIVIVPGRSGDVEGSYVYAMKTNAWCLIASPMHLRSVLTKACFVHGALYWLVQCGVRHNTDYLLTFDLSTHVFGSIELPYTNPRTIGPTIIQGSLGLVSVGRELENHGSMFTVWVRKDASWSVISNLDHCQRIGGLLKVLQLRTGGDMVFDTSLHGFQVCNRKIGVFSRLVDFSAAFFVLDIVQCAESLQLLDMGTACEGNKLYFS